MHSYIHANDKNLGAFTIVADLVGHGLREPSI